MLDVLVVGSGFWGAAIALKLREAGMNCLVVDSGDLSSATRNSGAYTCLRWFKSSTIRKHLPEHWTGDKISAWVEWLVEAGHMEKTGQWLYNERAETWKRSDDCYLMRDVTTLTRDCKPRGGELVRLAERNGMCRALMDGPIGVIPASWVVLAMGWRCDEVLHKSGLPVAGIGKLLGRAICVPPAENRLRELVDWQGEVVSIQVRPYKNFDLLPNNNRWWYFGATSEKEHSFSAYDEMLRAAAVLLGGECRVLGDRRGYRPVGGLVQQVSDHVIVASGGGRVGLALAGPAADDVLDLVR